MERLNVTLVDGCTINGEEVYISDDFGVFQVYKYVSVDRSLFILIGGARRLT